jgi:hypothetical protein
MNAATTNPAARLSNRQCAILRRLLAHEQSAASEAMTLHCMAVKALRGPGPKLAADCAAFSRAIRRLARRGLVILCNFARGICSGPNAGKVNIDPADKHAQRTRATRRKSASSSGRKGALASTQRRARREGVAILEGEVNRNSAHELRSDDF